MNQFELSREGVDFVKAEMQRYETKRSALIPCLFRVQEENGGWISSGCISYLSKLMDIPEAHVSEVFHFYTMFNKKPVGKLHVQVCCNISCAMNGGKELAETISKAYKTSLGKKSPCETVTVTPVECLGSCDGAPMMQVNDTYYENLDHKKALRILKELEDKYGN